MGSRRRRRPKSPLAAVVALISRHVRLGEDNPTEHQSGASEWARDQVEVMNLNMVASDLLELEPSGGFPENSVPNSVFQKTPKGLFKRKKKYYKKENLKKKPFLLHLRGQ